MGHHSAGSQFSLRPSVVRSWITDLSPIMCDDACPCRLPIGQRVHWFLPWGIFFQCESLYLLRGQLPNFNQSNFIKKRLKINTNRSERPEWHITHRNKWAKNTPHKPIFMKCVLQIYRYPWRLLQLIGDLIRAPNNGGILQINIEMGHWSKTEADIRGRKLAKDHMPKMYVEDCYALVPVMFIIKLCPSLIVDSWMGDQIKYN